MVDGIALQGRSSSHQLHLGDAQKPRFCIANHTPPKASHSIKPAKSFTSQPTHLSFSLWIPLGVGISGPCWVLDPKIVHKERPRKIGFGTKRPIQHCLYEETKLVGCENDTLIFLGFYFNSLIVSFISVM